MKSNWAVFLYLFASSTAALAEIDLTPAKATIYEAGTNRTKPVFHYALSVIPLAGGGVRSTANFTTMDGKLVYTEMTESKGGEVLAYEWNHLQMGQSGSVEIRDGKAHYTYRKGNEVQTDTAEAAENLVIGPTLVAYAMNHWADIQKGSAVPVRIGVPDRMNDYGFSFRREKDPAAERNGAVHVRLRPTSVFVSLAVKPIDFTFANDGSRLLTMEGRSLLKVKKDGKWEDLVTETVFE